MKIKKQQDVRDCGIHVIQALNAFFHGKFIDINKIKQAAIYHAQGISGANLINLGKKFGVNLTPYKVSLEILKEHQLKKYLVALIKNQNQNHYVIIKCQMKHIAVFDSINGKKYLSWKKFGQIFLNVIFIVEKIAFSYAQLKTTNTAKIFRLLNKKMWLIMTIWILMIWETVSTFASSFFIKIVVDLIIPHQLNNTLLVVTGGFIFLALIRSFNNFVQNYLVKKLTLKIEVKIYNLLIEKFTHALLLELKKITKTDYLRRLFLIPIVSQFIINFYLVILHQSFFLIATISVLLLLSPHLFIFAMIYGFFSVILICIFQLKAQLLSSKIAISQEKTLKMFHDLINSLHNFKNPDINFFLANYYSSTLTKMKNNEYQWTKMSWGRDFMTQCLELTGSIILIYWGIHLIFRAQLSIGTLLFFSNFFHYFMDILKNSAIFWTSYHQNRHYMRLIEFCLNLKCEWHKNQNLPQNQLHLTKIQSITLQNMQFNYDKFHLKIKYWKVTDNIHLQGANGTGKTTLLYLISGYYLRHVTPDTLFINQSPLNNYSLMVYRQKVCLLLFNEYLPHVNIWQYVTLNNAEAQKIFWHNYQKYKLDVILNKIGIDINYTMINNGANFSSGQRQFIICLRLLAFKYDVILLDEVVENIDDHVFHYLKWVINDFQQAIFIEISHAQKYLSRGEIINIQDIVTNG